MEAQIMQERLQREGLDVQENMPPCLFDQVHPDELQDPAEVLAGDDECDATMLRDDPGSYVMDEQFAYAKGILALYRSPLDCPLPRWNRQPGLVACGRMTSASWGTIRQSWGW